MEDRIDPPGTHEERALKAEQALREIFGILYDAEQEQVSMVYSTGSSGDYLRMTQKAIAAMDKVQDVIMDLYDLDIESDEPSWLDTPEEIAAAKARRLA